MKLAHKICRNEKILKKIYLHSKNIIWGEREKMNKNKIGTIFLVSVLALAGIGISYAGFTDTINVYGNVDTATVSLEIEYYSCTLLWKIWDTIELIPPFPGLEINNEKEIGIYHGLAEDWNEMQLFIENNIFSDNCKYEFESYAVAKPGTVHNDKTYDVDMIWNNIFPCNDFTADIVIHYTGSIPAKITNINFQHKSGNDFIQYTTWKLYKCTVEEIPIPQGLTYKKIWKGDEITVDHQLHNCDYICLEVTIHLQQDNTLQDKNGEFTVVLSAIQWYDSCPTPTL